MLHFYWPWLALLLPLPLLIRRFAKAPEEVTPELRFPALNLLKRAFPVYQTVTNSSKRVRYFLLFAVWVCLVLAVMQPERVDQLTQVNNQGYDLMVAVDISPSMQALDFSTKIKQISRLDVTKEVVGKFMLGRRGDRVGLITFGESAYLHVPLTLDTLSVSHMLNDTVAGMAGNATAIGDAVGLGVRTLSERPEGSRVLVLLTDGEDNSSQIPPLEAAKLAKKYGIRIYTIGVGKNGPVPFPSQFGGYRMVEMSIDEELLTKISDLTGGHYFRAEDQQALKAIYDKIDTLEKTESNMNEFFIRKPYYHYPLAVAMALLLLLIFFKLFSPVAYRKVPFGS